MSVFDYAQTFERELAQKYAREMVSNDLTLSNQGIKFLNAQTIKIPRLTVSGYKDHNRNIMGFNTGTASNDWEPKKLSHDRDIEIPIDPMDIDETNLVVEMANIQNVFEEEQAIPEKDSYRFSKLLTEATTYKSAGSVVDETVLTASNILEWFDEQMSIMDDKSVPSARLKTKYDFTTGCVPAVDAKQINMILVHPSCVISRDKYAYMKLFTPGSDSRTADKYVYQNRYYTDTFLIERKACGIAINKESA